MWVVLGAMVVVLMIDLLIRLFFVRIVLQIFETKPPFNVETAQADPSAECISFPTTNGLTLRGGLYQHPEGTARGLVVFCPELEANHWSVMSYCEGLYAAGFDILSFDFRNQGFSDSMPGYEPLHWLTEYEVDDVLAALDYVEQRTDLRDLPLGIMGVSRGSSAALIGAAYRPNVQAVCCDSAYSTCLLMENFIQRWAHFYMPEWALKLCPRWHIRLTMKIICLISQWRKGCRYVSLERWLSRLRDRRALLIAGDRDNYVPPRIGGEICRRLGPACDGVWIVPRAKHNGARRIDPEGYDERLVGLYAEMARTHPAESARTHRLPAYRPL